MKKQKLFTLLIPMLFPALVFSQNGIIGDGFGTSDWNTTDDFSGSAGNSRIGTFNPNSNGDNYFRLVTNWDGNFNQWGPSSTTEDYQVSIESEVPSSEIVENSTTKAYYINSSNTSFNYVFKTKESGNPPNNQGLIVFEIQGAVRSVSSVGEDKPTIYPGQAMTITANLDGSFSSGQSVYLRYTDDNFSTSTIKEMSGSGTSYTADIPANINSASSTINYYVFTSGDGISISPNDADWYTINLNNNSGSNYSYTVENSWTTSGDGTNWSDANSWDADKVPATGQPVTIEDDLTLDQDATVSSITVNNGATFTASDGSNRTLTIQDGGPLTNNGTFTASDGAVSFAGGGTISGSITFNDIDISGGVDFGSNSTVNGILTIKGGGFANNNAPTYGASSTLLFDTNESYTIDGSTTLWTTGATLGQGVPNDVTVNTTSPLNIYQARDVTGDLTINSGGSVEQGNNTFIVQGNLDNSGSFSFVSDGAQRLVVQGDLINQSGASIILSNTVGGDMQLEGDYQSDGTVNFNDRAIFFEGGNNQSVTGTNNPINFDYLYIAKSSGKVTFNQNVIVNDEYDQSGGDAEISSTATLEIGASAIADVGTGTTLTTNGNLTIKSDATGTGSLILNGTVTGSITSERYIVGYDPSGSDGWHLLSSPVDGMAISGSEFEPDDWSGNEDDLYAWDETNNIWDNYETGGITNFNNGQGYLVAYHTTATHDFTGTPNVSDVDRNLSYTSGQGEGWNLLGNPFQSAIKWKDGNWDATIGGNVQVTAKIRDESAGNYIDISSGDNDIIPANQGFFVKTSTNVTGFTIPKASRLHNSQNFYKNTKIASGYLKIKVSAAEHSFADIFRVWSHEEANDEYDAYDMEHFYGNVEAPQFYGIHAEAGNLSTYSLNPVAIENSRSIDLGLEAPVGEYNLTVESNTLEGDNDIYLHDQVTGEYVDLNEIDNHTFVVNEGNPTERFELLLNKTSTGIDKPHSEELEDVQVYSNQNTIHVNSNQKLSNATITVYNPLGQTIIQKSFDTPQNAIEVQKRATYIVRINADEGIKSNKVIIR